MVALLIFEFTDLLIAMELIAGTPVPTEKSQVKSNLPATLLLVATANELIVASAFDSPASSSIPNGAVDSPKASDADFKSNVACDELPNSSFISLKDKLY